MLFGNDSPSAYSLVLNGARGDSDPSAPADGNPSGQCGANGNDCHDDPSGWYRASRNGSCRANANAAHGALDANSRNGERWGVARNDRSHHSDHDRDVDGGRCIRADHTLVRLRLSRGRHRHGSGHRALALLR